MELELRLSLPLVVLVELDEVGVPALALGRLVMMRVTCSLQPKMSVGWCKKKMVFLVFIGPLFPQDY